MVFFFFSSRRRHTRWTGDRSSDVCSSDLATALARGRCERVRSASPGADCSPKSRSAEQPQADYQCCADRRSIASCVVRLADVQEREVTQRYVFAYFLRLNLLLLDFT